MRARHCDVCAVDVTNTCHFCCAECPDYDLCVDCFAANETVHSRHPYRIVEQCSIPIIDPDWGADEELQLIEAAETVGLGNWGDATEHVQSRTAAECESHYLQSYVASPEWPLPVFKKFDIDPKELRENRKARIEEKRQAAKNPPPIAKPLASVPACHDIQGYMPGRLEFETEFENDAELAVKDMHFEEDLSQVDPGEDELKLCVLDIYYRRLNARAERRRLIFDHGLLAYRKNQAIDKKRTKAERDIVNRAKPLARVQTAEDYETFVEGLLNEHRLRKRISELQTWRRHGCLTFAQGEKFDREMLAKTYPKDGFQLATGDRRVSSKGRLSLDEMGNPVRESTPQITGKQQRKASPLNIANATDVHLLTQSERNLCSQLRILPKAYLVIKETLFRELLRSGGVLKKRQARDLLKIDVNYPIL